MLSYHFIMNLMHKSLQLLYLFNYSIVCINYVGFIYPLAELNCSPKALMVHIELKQYTGITDTHLTGRASN